MAQVMELWEQKGVGNDPPSLTQRTCTLTLKNSDETMSIPMYTCTKVFEVKALVQARMGLEDGKLQFAYKAGCSMRQCLQFEEMPSKVVVLGIKSFKKVQHEYRHPHAIIGAGHLGLKTAMAFLLDGDTNFIIFDKRPKVGGTSWWEQANETSRLQTEVGAYHLQYHHNHVYGDKPFGMFPGDCRTNPWPSVQSLRKNFQEVAEGCGVLPYCRMNTNVAKMSVITPAGTKDWLAQHYELNLEDWENMAKKKKGQEYSKEVGSICMYPGNLTIPKRVTYKGEDSFKGDVVYGIGNNYDYSKCTGKNVVLIGSGAFTMENIRTCTEYHARKMYVVCRRKSMSMPRVVSWYINQTFQFAAASRVLDMSVPMYSLFGVDPWDYYSVITNESRSYCSMKQASRFGIGDVYFLTMYWGKTEHLVDDVKRVSEDAVHLNSGRTLEDITSMLKLLGFHGNFEVDNLLKIKEMKGFWVNNDHRRRCVAEPIGVDATNFGGTSFSPGALSWTDEHVYFVHYPKEFQMVKDSNMMPTHAAEPEIDRPAYVVGAKFGAMSGIGVGAVCPGFAEVSGATGYLKRQRMWQCNPIESFIEAATKEWDKYSEQFIAEGWRPDLKKPPYPYTVPMVMSYLKMELDDIQQQFGPQAADFAAKQCYPEGRAAFDKYDTSMFNLEEE